MNRKGSECDPDTCPLRHPLDAVDLRADILPAPLRRTPHVQDEPVLGSLLLPVLVHRAGTVVLDPARVCHFAPRASRILGHPARSALAAVLLERGEHDVANQAELRPLCLPARGARSALPRRHARVAVDRPALAVVAHPNLDRRGVCPVLSPLRSIAGVAPPTSGALADGADPWRYS